MAGEAKRAGTDVETGGEEPDQLGFKEMQGIQCGGKRARVLARGPPESKGHLILCLASEKARV